MQAIQQAILASPGLTLREVATAVGMSSRGNVGTVSALLSQLCQKGKLSRDSAMDTRIGVSRFWPTATTGIDQRRKAETKATRAAEKRESRARVATPKTNATAPIARKQAKPTAAQQFVINSPKPPRMPRRGECDKPETVEEFQARGGIVQQLKPHDSGNPLRFDHSANDVPTARRRPVVRFRKTSTV